MKSRLKRILLFLSIFVTLFSILNVSAKAQTKEIYLKLIPGVSMKFGSQNPHLGCQFDLSCGILLNNNFFCGIGSGYTTDMGWGGNTIPLYLDGKYFFSSDKTLLFKKSDELNQFLVEVQTGISINNNEPYKTGFIASGGIAYRFDFLKIKTINIPDFYLGLGLEFNHTKFLDEYRDYKIKDGKIDQLFLNIKLLIDIKPIVF
ncbi:MAG: hypothetical protein U0W24_05740 [Bacteroidales bacterium]